MASRFLNASYSVLSYAARRFAGISTAAPLPSSISIELSSICNLSCHECVTGAGQLSRCNSFLSYTLAEKIAEELRGFVLTAWLYFQGEPMMHPRFFDIAELFREMNPVISTNGHFLDRESCLLLTRSGLRKVIIAYDGATPEVYNLYRVGGDHRLVTEGIRTLSRTVREQRSPLKTELQFLIHRGNEHETGAAAAFAASVGARFRVKTMQLLDRASAVRWMPSDPKKSRYSGPEGRRGARPPLRGCFRMWRSAVITSDGDVVPCCFDKHGANRMGNLSSQSFSEIWRSEKYRNFRAAVMRSREEMDICRDCPQGTRLFFKS